MVVGKQEEPETREITEVLEQLKDHPELFNEKLIPLIQPAMRRIARRHLQGERAGVSVRTDSLVGEAYERLVKAKMDWKNRAHFLACTSNVMRQVLIDRARRYGAVVRGSGVEHLVPEDIAQPTAMALEDVLTVHHALVKLQKIDPVKAKIVHLKFFGGLKVEEIAEVMKLGRTTVNDHYRIARACLRLELGGSKKSSPSGLFSPRLRIRGRRVNTDRKDSPP